MFFLLSKIFWYLVQPLVVVLILAGMGFLALLMRRRRLGLWLSGTALLLLAVMSLSPLGLLMMSPLEERVPRAPLPERVDGIVVLGGALDTRITATRGVPELNDAADRMTAAVALSRQYPDARVLFSGGSAEILFEDISEAVAGRLLLDSLGLPADRLLLEDQSRNTWENAVYSRALAQPQEGEVWLLVTSAYHMPRAIGCFRVAGFDVVPFPVDYQTPSGPAVWRPSTASIRNVEKVHFAIREYIGLLAYWMTGRTDALFPRA